MSISAIVIEDNPKIRQALEDALTELTDVRIVGVAETEEEGIALLHGHCWQAAIVDMFLRKGSGLGVLQAIRDRHSSQRAVVLTNYATPDMRVRCLELKADAVFDKSTEFDALFDFMSQIPQ